MINGGDMVYKRKSCPHCGMIYKNWSSANYEEGSPIIECEFCHKTFIDKDYEEIGLEPFDEFKYTSRSKCFLSAIFPCGILAIIFFGLQIITQEIHIPLMVVGFLSLIGYFCFAIYYIKELPNMKAEYSIEYKKSRERLKDRKYVELLCELGYDTSFIDNTPLSDECPSCFKKISQLDDECSYCGYKLEQRKEERIQKNDKKTIRKVVSMDKYLGYREKKNTEESIVFSPNDIYLQYISLDQQGERRYKKLTKAEACIICRDNNINMKRYTVTFSTANKSFGHLYWSNPSIEVLNDDWLLILNDNIKRMLYVFDIPCNDIVLDELKVRSDNRERLDLQIYYGDKSFTDSRSGFRFGKYFVKAIKY